MRILVLECSTSAAKAMLFDTGAGVLAVRSQAFDRAVADGATQDADAALAILLRCGNEAVSQTDRRCDAVVLVTTWHSLLLCDAEGRPQGRLHLWSDLAAAGTAEGMAARPGFRREYYEKTGCVAHATYPFFKYMHLRKTLGGEQPDLYAQGEYLFKRLTGERAAALGVASGSGFLNLHTLRWDDGLLEMAGVRPDRLGPLRGEEYCAPLGAACASQLGVAAGTPVYPGGADGAMTQLGCEAGAPGLMTLSVGTSGALRIACEKPLLPEEGGTWCYYLADGRYIAGAATNGACNCVNAFQAASGRPIKELDALLGADGFAAAPVYLPFVFGERCPGWSSRAYGGFSTEGGTLAECYYAVLEGVVFNLYQCWLPLARAGGQPREIRLSGGILNCRYWVRMCADVFGCAMHASTQQHASLLGGAAVAARAAGEDIRGRIWQEEDVVLPDPEKAAYYRARFARYLECYENAQTRRENRQ